ncbi:MAG TPA: tyrosine-type recombinase/integrase [Candidatus Methanoperedens sp.]|nr:tyrosine-type recombinase/integrase [Candidatus Methanoperedens sp.]
MKATIAVREFRKHIKAYLDLRVRIFDHQPSGTEANARDLQVFSRYLEERSVRRISGETLLNFVTHLREARDNGAGAINRKIASIRSYVRYLRFAQVAGAEKFPIESLGRARQPYAGPVQTLEPQEVPRLFRGLDTHSVLGLRDFVLLSLLYRLGLRLGEALRITLEDVDLERQLLHVHGKGRRERTLPLVADLPEILENWLLVRQKLRNAERLPALFISKKGHRLSGRTAQENLQKIVARAGTFSIEKITPHTLRHAFASHAIEGDANLIVLKAVMGHASIKSTELYLHPSMRLLRKAVNDHVASEILGDLVAEKIVVLRVHQSRQIRAA